MDNLKADIEDRIYRPEKKNHAAIIFSICITAIVTGGGVYLLTKPSEAQMFIERDRQAELLRQQEQAAQKIERPAAQHKQPVRYEDVTSPHLEQWERESKERKQTVFNDDNYKPKSAANTIPAPRQTRTTQRRQTQNQINHKTAPWSWQSHGYGSGTKKKGRGGQFSYTVRNGFIDTGSVCNNYQYGSLVYRDCRKAAKAYFQRACNNQNREACSGADMMP